MATDNSRYYKTLKGSHPADIAIKFITVDFLTARHRKSFMHTSKEVMGPG